MQMADATVRASLQQSGHARSPVPIRDVCTAVTDLFNGMEQPLTSRDVGKIENRLQRIKCLTKDLSVDLLGSQFQRRRITEVLCVLRVLGWLDKHKKLYHKNVMLWGQSSECKQDCRKPFENDIARCLSQPFIIPGKDRNSRDQRNNYTICHILVSLGIYEKRGKHYGKKEQTVLFDHTNIPLESEFSEFLLREYL